MSDRTGAVCWRTENWSLQGAAEGKLDSAHARRMAATLYPGCSERCQDDVMSRVRRLSPWYWVMLSVLLVAWGVFVSNLFLDWAPKWLTSAALLVPLVASVYTFRMMWKQTDHPAFHGRVGSTKPPPSDNAKGLSVPPESKPDSR